MSITTDPRTVTSGRVAVSTTSRTKRDALLGRTALHTLADGTRVRGTIDGFMGWMPRMSITAVVGAGDPGIVGRWCRLDSVVQLDDGPEDENDPGVDTWNGRCDTCGAACDGDGCTTDRSHAVALDVDDQHPAAPAGYVTVVVTVAVPDDDRWDARLATAVEAAIAAQGLAPVPCNWAPDPDTIADGVGAPYGTVSVVDLNPSR